LLIDRHPEVVRKALAEMRADAVKNREEDLALAI
jgi:hypothetical protein